ncbi:uncharacterized protein LOC143035698 [Oratosquilla oratoria]|uniref:uncharacterized protein LOC143035698 n=1 Tax=Oratosquilla oratoria TaxID=337810 RepID=UPI003F75E03F
MQTKNVNVMQQPPSKNEKNIVAAATINGGTAGMNGTIPNGTVNGTEPNGHVIMNGVTFVATTSSSSSTPSSAIGGPLRGGGGEGGAPGDGGSGSYQPPPLPPRVGPRPPVTSAGILHQESPRFLALHTPKASLYPKAHLASTLGGLLDKLITKSSEVTVPMARVIVSFAATPAPDGICRCNNGVSVWQELGQEKLGVVEPRTHSQCPAGGENTDTTTT